MDRRAFTLIEMLVVVGIIAILIALLFPVIGSVREKSRKTRQQLDYSSISTGLEAYRQDFGDYPRVGPLETGSGFAVLCRAMIGPGPKMITAGGAPAGAGTFQTGTFICTATTESIAIRDTATTSGADWIVTPNTTYHDGADGPGFRVGPMVIDTNNDGVLEPAGKVYGPYLDADRFKTHGAALLDLWGNPVMYFPRSPQNLNLNNPATFYVAVLAPCMYNLMDNGAFAISRTTENDQFKTLRRMQVMLGDMSQDGKIVQPDEQAVTTAPYLLWSLGSDGHFGPLEDVQQWSSQPDWPYARKAVSRCDDVTNFETK